MSATSSTRGATLLVHAAVLVAVFTGCASSGPKRSEKTVDTMTDTHKALSKVRGQIGRTLDSLDRVVQAPPSELRGAFDRFAKNVEDLKDDRDTTRKRFEKMKDRKNDYISEWGKERSEVHDKELRDIAERRRDETRDRLDRVVGSLRIATDEFDPFLRDLLDVQKVLGNDLTAQGQSLLAGSSVVLNAKHKGSRVAESIDVALNDLAGASSDLSAGRR